jgi:DNA-binding response OmpR family regulator
MLAEQPSTLLLASHDPALLTALEPVLAASGAEVKVVLSGEEALAALHAPRLPDLALLDMELPGIPLGQLLAAARCATGGYRYPIVLLADEVKDEWAARLSEGVLDDLIPRSPENPHWRIRLDAVLRSYHRMRDLDRLRRETALNAQVDALTRV